MTSDHATDAGPDSTGVAQAPPGHGSERAPWWDRAAPRLAAFGAALAVLFAGGWGMGAWAGGPESSPADRAPAHAPGRVAAEPGADGAGSSDLQAADAASGVGGLEVSRAGYALETMAAPTTAGVPGELVFRVTGPTGAPVTAFTPTHDKALHLIVVRRDQSGFQHLHPEMSPDGTWRTPITLGAGDHRLLADFAPDTRTEALTLGRDLAVAGDYRPEPLPGPSNTATTPDGYTVNLAGELVAGTSSPLRLTVTKDGTPVGDLQPYLAAYGHLVALRAGDLAYLHVHPEGAPDDGRTPAGPDITFAADVPTPGAYRLHLDFAHQGAVRTVEFTAFAGPANPANPAAAGADAAGAGARDGHGGGGHGH